MARRGRGRESAWVAVVGVCTCLLAGNGWADPPAPPKPQSVPRPRFYLGLGMGPTRFVIPCDPQESFCENKLGVDFELNAGVQVTPYVALLGEALSDTANLAPDNVVDLYAGEIRARMPGWGWLGVGVGAGTVGNSNDLTHIDHTFPTNSGPAVTLAAAFEITRWPHFVPEVRVRAAGLDFDGDWVWLFSLEGAFSLYIGPAR